VAIVLKRGLVLVAAAALGACAQADTPGGMTDAALQHHDAGDRAIDGPRATDAAHAIDAPRAIDAPAAICVSGATCAAATSLGSISGDTNADQAMATGYESAWYQVRVTEDDSGVFGVPMNISVELNSPAAPTYQLFVYLNTGTDAIECTTPHGSAAVNGAIATQNIQWGETGTFSNGDDDSRTVSIEVRAPATGCSPNAAWNLFVYGDT
jgi:hypothetical protein